MRRTRSDAGIWKPRTRPPFVGERYGMLVVLKRVPKKPGVKGTESRWLCQCDCGKQVVRSGLSFRRDKPPSSCGCNCVFPGTVMHGCTGTPTHKTWMAMRRRCSNKKDANYERYGGRGIRVCKRWDQFVNFLADMGERPPGCTLDRIDVNGNYCPENCRWLTVREQNVNQRRTIRITFQGRTQCLLDWARELGISCCTLKYRLKNWPLEKALTESKGRKYPRYKYKGRLWLVTELAAASGLSVNVLYARLAAGWAVERAVSTPTRKKRRGSRVVA